MDWRQALLRWRIQFRRGTTEAWTSADPILLLGEPGWDQDLKQLKMGDGVTAWNELGWASLTQEQAEDISEILGVGLDSAVTAIATDVDSDLHAYLMTIGGGGGGDSVTSVNGHSGPGAVTVTKGDISLGSVDNTSDSAKLAAFQTVFDSRYESLGNKATSGSLGTSDTFYPSQKAVKTYVDTIAALLATKASPTFTGTVTAPTVVVTTALTTPALRLGTSTTSGYVLTADASGNGTWQATTGGGDGSVLIEDPDDPGTYIIAATGEPLPIDGGTP